MNTENSKKIFLYNRGIGDMSWLAHHEQLQATLEPFLQTQTCTLRVHGCGFPCGGYHYTVEMSTADAAKIEAALATIGFADSVHARADIEMNFNMRNVVTDDQSDGVKGSTCDAKPYF